MTKPRWSDESVDSLEIENGLSSDVVERADHAGKLFKHSNVCNGQGLIKYAGPTADNFTHQRAHSVNKD